MNDSIGAEQDHRAPAALPVPEVAAAGSWSLLVVAAGVVTSLLLWLRSKRA